MNVGFSGKFCKEGATFFGTQAFPSSNNVSSGAHKHGTALDLSCKQLKFTEEESATFMRICKRNLQSFLVLPGLLAAAGITGLMAVAWTGFPAAVMAADTPATSSPPVLTFQAWKDKQILEAQNLVLRTSARISQLRTGKNTSSEVKSPESLPKGKLKKASEADLISLAEGDLKRAQETMDAANNLQIEDYIHVYLPTLHGRADAVQILTERLTKEELGELFKGLMLKETRNDTKQNSRLLDELNVSTQAQAR
ncbi:MAG: hypothetical protein AB7G93_19775 [Bdellovibrionales bacterium]